MNDKKLQTDLGRRFFGEASNSKSYSFESMRLHLPFRVSSKPCLLQNT